MKKEVSEKSQLFLDSRLIIENSKDDNRIIEATKTLLKLSIDESLTYYREIFSITSKIKGN